MYIYIGATILSCFLINLGKYSKKLVFRINKKSVDFYSILGFLPLYMLAILRYGIGNDYFPVYVSRFYKAKDSSIFSFGEIAYNLLEKTIASLTSDYFWLFFVCSSIVMINVWKAIYELSEDVTFSVFIFVFMQLYSSFFCIVRQSIATSVFLISLVYLKRKRCVLSVVYKFLATFFHTSAWLYFLFGILSKIKVKKSRVFAISLLALVPLLPGFSSYFRNFVRRYLQLYQFTRYFDSVWDSGNILISLILINGCILLFETIIWRDVDSDSEINSILYYMQVGTFFISCLSGVIPIASRVITLLSVGQIILVPNLTRNRFDNSKMYYFVKTLVVTAFLLTMIWQLNYYDGYEIAVYHGIWER